MRNLAPLNFDESTVLFPCTLEWTLTQFFLRWWISWWVKMLLLLLILLERTFGWALSPSPCSFLFAFHLERSFNTDKKCWKKIKCSLHICKLVFHFSLWFKLSIFFSLIFFFCRNPAMDSCSCRNVWNVRNGSNDLTILYQVSEKSWLCSYYCANNY